MIKVSEEAKVKITNLMGEVGYNVKKPLCKSWCKKAADVLGYLTI